MTETITRMYATYQHAINAVNGLKARGFTDDQISLIANAGADASDRTTTGTRRTDLPDTAAGEGAGTGAGVGGVLGAGAGLLAGLGIMAIPGVGPVVAAGWLAATAAGAVAGALAGGAAGGIVGSLINSGVSEADAHVYAEGVRRGGSLVTVRAPDELAPEAIRILDSFGPIDPGTRRVEYQREGWTQFDEKAPMRSTTDTMRRTQPPRSTAAE
jgi:hypothetical protein